jgi:lysophospholipase L1-like esterase
MEWVLGLVVLLVVVGGASRKRGARALAKRALPARLLLAGDSHAQGLEPHLKQALRARSVPLDVSFIVGSTARDWRREFLGRALERSSAPVVLLVLGTNDCASPLLSAEFPGNVRVLVERVKAAGRSVVLLQAPGACARVRSALELAGVDVLLPPEMPMNGIHATPAGYARWSAQILEMFS